MDISKEKQKKTNQIIKALSSGIARNTLAKKYKYKSWKGLDMFMRREGYHWNSNISNYSLITKYEAHQVLSSLNNISSNIAEIIKAYDNKEEPKKIAQIAGLNSHQEVALLMKKNGYIWSSDIGNYIPEKIHNGSSYCFIKPTQSKKVVNTSPVLPANEEKSKLDLEHSEYIDSEVMQKTNDLISKYKDNKTALTVAFFLGKHCEKNKLELNIAIENALLEYLHNNGYEGDIKSLLKNFKNAGV